MHTCTHIAHTCAHTCTHAAIKRQTCYKYIGGDRVYATYGTAKARHVYQLPTEAVEADEQQCGAVTVRTGGLAPGQSVLKQKRFWTFAPQAVRRWFRGGFGEAGRKRASQAEAEQCTLNVVAAYQIVPAANGGCAKQIL